MKANELMIGDWVECVDSTHKEKVYAQIDAIEEGQTCILVRIDNCNWFLDISFIKPISLTQEILKKNGFYLFSRDIKYITYCINELQISVSYVKDTKEWMVFLGASGSVKKKFVEVSCVKYVHELQHALKLCGIEKEIEL